MKILYEKYKGKIINGGIIVGYSEDKLLLAVQGNPMPSFKRLDRDTYIDEEYKTGTHRFVYCDESTVEKFLGVRGV